MGREGSDYLEAQVRFLMLCNRIIYLSSLTLASLCMRLRPFRSSLPGLSFAVVSSVLSPRLQSYPHLPKLWIPVHPVSTSSNCKRPQ